MPESCAYPAVDKNGRWIKPIAAILYLPRIDASGSRSTEIFDENFGFTITKDDSVVMPMPAYD
jgi:hypothetical protein